MREFLHSFSKLEFDKIKLHIQRYAVSDFGRERVHQLAPAAELEEIQRSHAFVTEMKRLLETNEPPPIDQLPDIRLGLQRLTIENFILPADGLHQVAVFLETSRKTQTYFSRKRDDFPLLSAIATDLYIDKILEYNINQAIDEYGKVKDNATKELSSIRKQMIETSDMLRKRLESLLKSFAEKDWTQEEIITTRDARMVIPLKSEFKNRVPGFIHSTSASGATVFIEPTETLELNNEIRTLQFREQREIEKILRELTNQVREVREHGMRNVEIMGALDFIQAKAKYSIEILGNEPIVKLEGPLRLIEGRHPLLFQRHRREEVVPLSLEIGGETKTVVISGPNAGGKSVALKTVGILSILSQSGCQIPAQSGSEFPIFTELFVDIGDEQSIENDLSSFSSHLRNLKEVVDNITPSSLVLMDEIASGTDPVEGASLASSLLESLTKLGCTTIVTTHHGSLKTFAANTDGVENAAMEFDQRTLRPTYRFQFGVPGSSYAIEMAERMRIPHNIIQRAKDIRGDESYNIDKLVMDLQRQSQELKDELEHAGEERRRLARLTQEYEQKASSLEKHTRELKLKAAQEAEAIVSTANAVIEKAIREIKEQNAQKDIIRSAKEEVRAVQELVSKLARQAQPAGAGLNREITRSDKVRLKNSNTIGEVLEKIDENYFYVLAGDLKLKVHRRDLELTGSPKKEKLKSAQQFQLAQEVKHEVDLRGMYGDEAINVIEKLFDEAILSGLHRVDLIHGKGTGALRKRITEYLKSNPAVKSFRLGNWDEGGTGVTVVELA